MASRLVEWVRRADLAANKTVCSSNSAWWVLEGIEFVNFPILHHYVIGSEIARYQVFCGLNLEMDCTQAESLLEISLVTWSKVQFSCITSRYTRSW
jgi:hypothetical protein